MADDPNSAVADAPTTETQKPWEKFASKKPWEHFSTASPSPDAPKKTSSGDAGIELEKQRLKDIPMRFAEKALGGAEKVVEGLTPEGLLNMPNRLLGMKDAFKANTPVVQIPKPTGTGVAAGLGRLGAGLLEGFETPESIVTLPAAAQSAIVRTIFGGQMAVDLPDDAKNAIKVLQDPNATKADKVEAVGNPIVKSAMIAGLSSIGKPQKSGIKLEDIQPAIKTPAGEIHTGDDHVAAYEAAKEKTPDTSGSHEGFQHTDPNTGKETFITREQAAHLTQLPTERENGKLHSSDLAKFKGMSTKEIEQYKADRKEVAGGIKAERALSRKLRAGVDESKPVQTFDLGGEPEPAAEPPKPHPDSIEDISAMTPKEFSEFVKPNGQTHSISTTHAYELGAKVETPEQLNSLLDANNKAEAEANAAKDKMDKNPSIETAQAFSDVSTGKTHYFHEAVQAAYAKLKGYGTDEAGIDKAKADITAAKESGVDPFAQFKKPSEPTPAPVAAKSPQPHASKEPWQQKYDDYAAGLEVTSSPSTMMFFHKEEVEKALREGKPVPPEVLEDYPELKSPQPVVEAPRDTKNVPVGRETPPAQSISDKPLADKGLVSYRYKSPLGGWIMIGAKDHADAINEANRSLEKPNAAIDNLQVWNGKEYVPAKELTSPARETAEGKGSGTVFVGGKGERAATPEDIKAAASIIEKNPIYSEWVKYYSGAEPFKKGGHGYSQEVWKQAWQQAKKLMVTDDPASSRSKILFDGKPEDYKPTPAEPQQGKEPTPAPVARSPESFKSKSSKLAKKLDALKSGVDPSKGDLNLFGAIPKVWDAAIETAQKVIRAGGAVADAVDAAIKYIKENHKGEFREADARKYLGKEFENLSQPLEVEEFEPLDPATGSPKDKTFDAADSERNVTGLAARVRSVREMAGLTEPTEAGEGISPEASYDRGREMIASGVDPEEMMRNFEETGRANDEDMSVAFAHTANLSKLTNAAEDKFGINSPQFKEAYKAESDWAARTKKMQSVWSRMGHGQQGSVNVDTDSFAGLKRLYRDSHDGQEMPKADEAKAQEIADKNLKLAEENKRLLKQLSDAIDKETSKEPPVEPHIRLVADKLKGYFEERAKSALDRIKARRAEGRLFTGIDPTELKDYAEYGAAKIISKGIEGAEMSADWAKEMKAEIGDYIEPHLKQIWKAAKETFETGLKKFAGLGEAGKKVRKAVVKTAKAETPPKSVTDLSEGELTATEKADLARAKSAQQAAQKTVREAAAKVAKVENEERGTAQKLKTREQNVQTDAARKALQAAQKTVRDNAKRIADLENKQRIAAATKKQVAGTLPHARTEFMNYKGGRMTDDQVRALWKYAKDNYINKGNADFSDIVRKISTDLGLQFKDVANGLAQPKSIKKLTNEIWRKQTDARRVSEAAQRWARQINSRFIGQAVPRLARIMFGLKVFGHGGVAFGTHAPMVAFMPKYWNRYFRDFGKMYKMVFSPAEYEINVQALRNSKNFDTAQRAGLVNDPYKVEDFNNPDMAQYLGRLSGAGNRGYFALKILRQDLFDQGWDKLPESMKTPELAKAMSDDINHITGVVKAGSGNTASLFLFAPKLLMSRAAFLIGDPYKAVEVMSTVRSVKDWKELPEHEKFLVRNQLLQKATVLGTAYALLQANQAMLSAMGSNQKINTSDPMKSDFMKFKAVGMDFSYGNAMLNFARFPVRLWTIGAGDGGKLKYVIYPDESMYSAAGEFLRTQLSPMASLGADIVFKGDYQKRPLPQIPFYGKPIPMPKRLAAQGVKPYTWPEFFAEQALPIPAEEAVREIWRTGLGASPEQMKELAKAAGTLIVMTGTGGRLTEDTQVKK